MPPTPPTNGDGGNGNGPTVSNNGVGGNGQVLGAIDGAVLPVTGSSLLLLLIANILMFLLGCYLRLRSGRSPAYAYL